MRSISKTLLIKSSIAAISLVCTFSQVSHAFPKVTIESSSIAKNQVSYRLFAPQTTNDKGYFLTQSSNVIVYIDQHPLLPETASAQTVYKSCKSKKKNELYELSAIFNDKLQLFLSYFDEHQSYKIAEKHNASDDLSVSTNVDIH